MFVIRASVMRNQRTARREDCNTDRSSLPAYRKRRVMSRLRSQIPSASTLETAGCMRDWFYLLVDRRRGGFRFWFEFLNLYPSADSWFNWEGIALPLGTCQFCGLLTSSHSSWVISLADFTFDAGGAELYLNCFDTES